MKLLIHNASLHESSVQMYHEIAQQLRKDGQETEVVHGELKGSLPNFNFLLSNAIIPLKIRQQVTTCGGVLLNRAESMSILEQGGLDVMKWCLAKNRDEVRSLSETWNTDRILLKRSFTYGGDGVEVFDTSQLPSQIDWNPEKDIFCAEVNPTSGDVYKAELFNGEIVISWMSEAPPLQKQMNGTHLQGVKGAYGERRVFEFPEEVAKKLSALSKELTRHGVGYISLDLMKDPSGNYQAIEINLSMIATWWTVQFSEMKERYARAITCWIKPA